MQQQDFVYPAQQASQSKMYPLSTQEAGFVPVNFESASSNDFMDAPVKNGIEYPSEEAR